MRYEIMGTTMQALSVELQSGDRCIASTNTMAWMSPNIEMATHTGGGLFAVFKRTRGGGGGFVTDFTASAPGHLAFAPRFPGTILAQRGPEPRARGIIGRIGAAVGGAVAGVGGSIAGAILGGLLGGRKSNDA